MRCKIVRAVYVAQYYKVNQKSKKFSVLHYGIDMTSNIIIAEYLKKN